MKAFDKAFTGYHLNMTGLLYNKLVRKQGDILVYVWNEIAHGL
jgi:hypothetical protein